MVLVLVFFDFDCDLGSSADWVLAFFAKGSGCASGKSPVDEIIIRSDEEVLGSDETNVRSDEMEAEAVLVLLPVLED